jgi:Ca2+-binding RTX toxin-like protein
LSYRTPLESLEPRTLLAGAPLPPELPTNHGVHLVGRTVVINGTAGRDFIRIQRAPDDAGGEERSNQIQVTSNQITSVFRPRNMKRYVINGFAGDDVIRVEGDLPAVFNPRALIILGGDGNDTITGSRFADKIFGGSGDDNIVGFSGADVIHGEAGNDRIDGGYGGDRIFGEDGNDTLVGGPGNDRLFGGPGDDTFVNNETDEERRAGGRDLLDGGGGVDIAEYDFQDRRRLIAG